MRARALLDVPRERPERGSRSIISAYDANTGLNAVQLDIKNENGDIGFTEDMPSLAIKSGAAHDFYEPRVIVEQLHARPAST